MMATPVANAIHVAAAYQFGGHHWLEVPVRDWDDVCRLPAGLMFEGRAYGRTGWDSDRGVAYYSTRQAFATTTI